MPRGGAAPCSDRASCVMHAARGRPGRGHRPGCRRARRPGRASTRSGSAARRSTAAPTRSRRARERSPTAAPARGGQVGSTGVEHGRPEPGRRFPVGVTGRGERPADGLRRLDQIFGVAGIGGGHRSAPDAPCRPAPTDDDRIGPRADRGEQVGLRHRDGLRELGHRLIDADQARIGVEKRGRAAPSAGRARPRRPTRPIPAAEPIIGGQHRRPDPRRPRPARRITPATSATGCGFTSRRSAKVTTCRPRPLRPADRAARRVSRRRPAVGLR